MEKVGIALPGFSKNNHLPEDTTVADEQVDESDENVERGNWSSKTDYLLSMIGYAVGLGNVWRFPYLAYKNGGGAFLIPYVIMLALAGMPLFFLECSFGQFASLGPVAVWKAVPILQGVGITMVLVSTFVTIYYNCIIAYSLYYLFASFQFPLPWTDCFSWWGADETCSRSPKDPLCNLTLDNGYFEIVNKTWLHVVYFTATFPYLVLIILLIRGATLEGAYKGIEYYIGSQSNITKLRDAEIWKDAATQIFYSLSVAWGGLTALSSYNKFHNNCYTDAIIVCVINCGTSVFAGFAIFSILGHMAHIQDKLVSEVAKSGFGLAFIAYPEALAQLPVAPLWSILFFFMLVTLGLDSQFASIETIVTTLLDQFPNYLRSKRIFVTSGACLVFFLLGLVCVTQSGIYWINLIDHFTAGWGILIAAVVEIIGLSWVYGINRFIKDIEMMIGGKNWLFWLWWRACWGFISPVLLLAILIWSLVTFIPPTYGLVEYPGWATALGWCMIIFYIMWIPIIAIVKIVQAKGSNLWQKIVAASKPTPDWGPYLKQHRGGRYDKTNQDFTSNPEMAKR
ncbi:hypothetical protein scyTo_0015822 [Scyliorhinus torazame]|uniref:Transporter n=1 Tax=Scyliorhinus torazame TaxID=75743 RepID=A0A401PZ22_SCYTO|nr:hypothetical protein [Scyliorhinus torazame]